MLSVGGREKGVDFRVGCLHCVYMNVRGAWSQEHGAGGAASFGSRQFSAQADTLAVGETSRPAGRRGRGGFSLIELMVVMVVISILAGITLAAMGGVNQRAARDRTKAEIAAMANALEAYKSQNGKYPDPASNNTVPYQAIRGYLATDRIDVGTNNVPVDPFGVAYSYRQPGTRNRVSFDLSSRAGAGATETNKHIGNW
jgi:general secretion pathway protein G